MPVHGIDNGNNKKDVYTTEEVLSILQQAIDSGTLQGIDPDETPIVAAVRESHNNSNVTFWSGTEDEFNALDIEDSELIGARIGSDGKLYLLTGDTTLSDTVEAARQAALEATEGMKREVISVTLAAAGWSNTAPYTQTVAVPGMTADKDFLAPYVVPTGNESDDLAAQAALSCISGGTTDTDSVTFYCYDEKPTTSITVFMVDKGTKLEPGDYPVASASSLGMIRVGDNLSIDPQTGRLSATGGGGSSITVDAALSTSSTNPVQNKVVTTALNLKANTSDVAATYATKNEVNSKANAADVAETYATKTQLSRVVSGSPLSASSTSEMTELNRIYVNTTDGHWYYYDGEDWADGGVYQATEIADDSVAPRKTTFYKRTTNLFDKDNPQVLRALFNTQTSKIVAAPSNKNIFVVYIPCEPSTTYVLRKTKGWRFQIACTATEPADGVSYSGYSNATKWNNQDVQKVYTTPADAAYLAIYIYHQDDVNNPLLSDIFASLMISEGETQNYYEPYAYLDFNDYLDVGSIGNDKLAVQSLMLYEGKIYVNFYTNKITLSDDLTDFVSANNDRRLVVSGSVAREFTISDTRLMVLTATVSGSTITSIQLELYSERDISHPIIMYVCKGNRTYSAPYEYNKSIVTEAKVAKLFQGTIIIDRANSVINFDNVGFLVGDGFEQVNVNVTALPTELVLPNDYTSYALTLSVNGTAAASYQLEKWDRINPANHIICYLRGNSANKNLFAPYDYRGRIRYADEGIDYENDVTLGMFNRIAAIGDSYTRGIIYYGNTEADAHTSPGKKLSYIGVMGRRNGTDWDNYGIGGITTRGYLTHQEGLPAVLAGEKSDLYFLALGINDAGKLGAGYLGTIADITDDYVTNPDTFYGNYARIIEQVQAYAPHAKLVMVGIMRPDSMNANYASFRAAIKEIAEHYELPYLDPYADRFFTSSIMATLSGNHPTAAGYTGIALALERLFARAVEENPTYWKDADYGSVVDD